MRRREFVAGLLIGSGGLVSCGGGAVDDGPVIVAPPPSTATTAQGFRWRGFNMTAWQRDGLSAATWPVGEALGYMASQGSNFIALDWAVNFQNDGSLVSLENSLHPKLADIKSVIAQAKARGWVVCLKPHCTMPATPENRNFWNTSVVSFMPSRFFPAWGNYLSDLVRACPEADGLCVGTELNHLDTAYRNEWSTLIGRLRQETNQWLTYDAIFNRWAYVPDIGDVVFWDLLDYIGVSLYVPVSRRDDAGLDSLMAAWQSDRAADGEVLGDIGSVTAYLQRVSRTHARPILVLEGGYQSVVGGLLNVNGSPSVLKTPDNDLQARGIEAFLKVLIEHQSPDGVLSNWLAGVSLWQVTPVMMTETNLRTMWHTQEFSAYRKPAAQVIGRYFSVQP